jgi:serine/threonine-protein kinase SRPK3
VSGEAPGPEAPRYIVKTLDFLASEEDMISNDISIIDFDQTFLVSSPPRNMLATPIEFLAPEVAAGRPASPASDVWALGYSILRLRSGEGLSSPFDVTSPADLLRGVIRVLGDMPASWEDMLFDSDGQPTKDLAKGKPLQRNTDRRPIRDWVYRIWDEPSSTVGKSEDVTVADMGRSDWERHTPYPYCFSHKFWKPTAIKVRGVSLDSYGNESDDLLEALPKIQEDEAALLCDLLSKIFVYEPSERMNAGRLPDHRWFHMDD